jgi:hypothetical protein
MDLTAAGMLGEAGLLEPAPEAFRRATGAPQSTAPTRSPERVGTKALSRQDIPRAPLWMQRLSLEWLHRLLGNPRRFWRRYLIDGPRIFVLAWKVRR